MTPTPPTSDHRKTLPLLRLAPGLQQLLGYQRGWLPHDLAAGVSVAAVAIPTAVAYAQIMGLQPVIGLYAAILPLVAYAVLGTSRHLIVNPDAATCALVGTTLAPLAAGNPDTLLSLAITLAFFTGVVCVAAGFFRLGFVADFLSRPILVGFLNGVAIYIFISQIGKLFGFPMNAHGIIPSAIEFVRKVPQTHVPTLIVGLLTMGVLLGSKRLLPRWPGPLLAVVFAVGLVKWFDLSTRGVAVVGHVPAGLPHLRWPEFDVRFLNPLLGGALGVALLSFSNAMVVARSFASKNRYDVDADKELFALGACQIVSGLSQGFPISGADSRTALNHAMGGRSQLAGLVAAGVMAAVLLFLTVPLAYLPKAALGAILIQAAIGLFDLHEMRHIWKVSWQEFAVAVFTMLGVVGLGVLDGIVLAVVLSLFFLLARSSRPPDAVVGRVAGLRGFHDVAHHELAETRSGIVLYRFRAAIVFFNAPYFKKRALETLASRPGTRWFVVDGGPVNFMDSTGASAVEDLAIEMKQRGVKLGFAQLRSEVRSSLERAGVKAVLGEDAFFPTLNSALRAFEGSSPAASAGSDDAS